jgi:hypothetical protein
MGELSPRLEVYP